MVNLIVVGAKGKSALRKILVGSTTSESLKYSRFPTLVVKKTDTKKEGRLVPIAESRVRGRPRL
jgi:hypothetical protein